MYIPSNSPRERLKLANYAVCVMCDVSLIFSAVLNDVASTKQIIKWFCWKICMYFRHV